MWEAHLLLLFAEATRLAESDSLPPETPAFVASYFAKKGEVSHREFLKIDEPALQTCITLWSDSDTASERLKLLSSAFLERRKILGCLELPDEDGSAAKRSQLRKKLGDKAGDEGTTWLIDLYDFPPYKMPSSKQLESDPESYWESVSKNSILLASGDLSEKSFPIQKDSRVIKSLGYSKMPVCRLFFLPEIADAVKSSTT